MLRHTRTIRAARTGMTQQVKALGIGRHHSVLDAVVHHLHEMTGTRRATVQITFRGRVIRAAASDRFDFAATRREITEDRFQPLHGLARTADHQAVAAFETPDTAAGADVYKVNARRAECFSPPDGIFKR